MKLLLTSNGLSNGSIARAFQDLIGKEPAAARVAFIPTAANPERDDKSWVIDDMYRIKELGYFIDIVDLTAFKEADLRTIMNTMDAVFVGGGNSFYLSYWMQKSGMFGLLQEFVKDKVYAGISAGSMLAGASLVPSDALDDIQGFRDDLYYEKVIKGEASAKALEFADLVFRPHLNSDIFPKVRKEILEQVADKLTAPMYALDDESALKIVDGEIEVVTEGQWLKLSPEGNT
jgi:dipeptidase E